LGLTYSRLGLQDSAKIEMEKYQRLRQSEDERQKRLRSAGPPPAAGARP